MNRYSRLRDPYGIDSGVGSDSSRHSSASSRSPGHTDKDSSPAVVHATTRTIGHNVMPTTTLGNKSGVLAQQIHDEFLTCKICLEAFTEPKCLDCLHTFCEECIENHANSESSYKKYSDYREFTCPLCRKRTNLPLGGVKKLPDNFLVASLTEVIDRQKPSKYPVCDICKMVSRKHKEASSKCLDCNKILCKTCVDQHKETKVTSKHNVFDMEIEKDIECKQHPEEVVRFYCETCETAVCILCTFNDHKEHNVIQFSDAVKRHKSNVQNLLDNCKGSLEKFEQDVEKLSQCDECIKTAESKIHDVALEMIADIRNRERLLIEEIHNMYGEETLKLIGNKADLKANLEGLKKTVQLTDMIVNGKDMELLLLQREVQNNLISLSKAATIDLPRTVNKVIAFMPGMLDMGYIHDSDRPLLSQTRRTLSNMSERSEVTLDPSDYMTSTEAQTDLLQGEDKSTNTPFLIRCEEGVQTDETPSTPLKAVEEEPSERHHRRPADEDEVSERRRRRRRERERDGGSTGHQSRSERRRYQSSEEF